jgi:hypothetical protein
LSYEIESNSFEKPKQTGEWHLDLAQLIRNRRTIQTFTNASVDDAVVKEALELSFWSLNHRLTFPWFYMIVPRNKREQLTKLAIDLKAKKKPMTDAVKQSMHQNFMNPSHYIAVGLKKNADPVVEKENYATLACSMQIASLVLWEKGVGSKWTTSGFSTHPETYKILGISPEEIQLEGGMMVGGFDKVPPAAPRPSLDEVLI